MQKFFRGLGHFSVKYRWFIIVFWIAGTFASIQFLPSLGSVVTNSNRAFLASSSPSIQAANLASPFLNSNDSQVIVVAQTSQSKLSPTDRAAFVAVLASMKKEPTVLSVKVAGVSPDQRAIQGVIISKTGPFGATGLKTLVGNLRSAIKATPVPSDLSVHLAGQTAVTVDSNSGNSAGPSNAQNYSVLLVVVILLIVFRAVLAPFVTLLPAVFVVLAGGPIIAEASKAGFTVSFVTQLLFIILIIGAGTDYGLFLVFRVREELRRGLEPKAAVSRALEKVGESITFSSATVIAALLSLVTASFGFYRGLGWPLAIGVALMLIAGLTLLPAILAVLGRAVFWPTSTRPGEPKVGLWGRIAARVVTRPVTTLIIGLVIFGSLAVASFGNSPSGFASASTAPKGSDSYYGTQILNKEFPSSSFNPTEVIFKFKRSVWSNLSNIEAMQTDLSHQSTLKSVFGPFNVLATKFSASQLSALNAQLGSPAGLPAIEPANLSIPPKVYQAYRSEYQFISKDGRTILFVTSLSAGNAASTAALNATPLIRSQVGAVANKFGAEKYGVAGLAPAAYDIASSSSSDLVKIVPVVIIIIGVLLALVLRSGVAPLYLMISVILSYLAALGADVIVFIYFGGNSGLNFVLPFLLFLFLLALGEDYNILVMTRIREEAQHRDLRSAVKVALNATGSTVTSAGMVLAGTFAVLALAQLGNSQVEEIGFGLALGIVMDTFLVRTLLVPSVVVLLGHWNWWPSHLFKESHSDLEAARWEAEQAEMDNPNEPSGDVTIGVK